MPHREPLAFDHVLAGRSDVEQQVDQVILQQVHLIDVQEAAMGARQQPGFKRLHAVRQRALEIQGADHPVLGGTQRQVHHRHGHLHALRLGDPAASLAQSGWLVGLAAVGTTGDGAHRRQECRERPHGRGLARAPIAEHENAADALVHGGDQQGELHLVLADDG